jgi:hypothetical protein
VAVQGSSVSGPTWPCTHFCALTYLIMMSWLSPCCSTSSCALHRQWCLNTSLEVTSHPCFGACGMVLAQDGQTMPRCCSCACSPGCRLANPCKLGMVSWTQGVAAYMQGIKPAATSSLGKATERPPFHHYSWFAAPQYHRRYVTF